MKKRFTDKPGYFTFTLIGSLIVIIGILMNVFDLNSSYNGLKYDISEEKLSISGNQVIMLGATLLIIVLAFYLVDRKRKAHK